MSFESGSLFWSHLCSCFVFVVCCCVVVIVVKLLDLDPLWSFVSLLEIWQQQSLIGEASTALLLSSLCLIFSVISTLSSIVFCYFLFFYHFVPFWSSCHSLRLVAAVIMIKWGTLFLRGRGDIILLTVVSNFGDIFNIDGSIILVIGIIWFCPFCCNIR